LKRKGTFFSCGLCWDFLLIAFSQWSAAWIADQQRMWCCCSRWTSYGRWCIVHLRFRFWPAQSVVCGQQISVKRLVNEGEISKANGYGGEKSGVKGSAESSKANGNGGEGSDDKGSVEIPIINGTAASTVNNYSYKVTSRWSNGKLYSGAPPGGVLFFQVWLCLCITI